MYRIFEFSKMIKYLSMSIYNTYIKLISNTFLSFPMYFYFLCQIIIAGYFIAKITLENKIICRKQRIQK